ncbi:MAG: hypothetical protein IT437_09720 [Phycisphaerales bacterium]|nr:hypothetical protein [Phycisphaerales bacterium]
MIGPLLLAAVFAFSGAGKALRPEHTSATVGVLLRTQSYSSVLVVALILIEFALATWLISGWAPRAALAGTILALLGFSVALGALLIVKPSSPCGCGLPAVSGNAAVDNGIGLARNALLMVIGVVAWPSRLDPL